jgi:GDPmannose 4,6-dehydratase
VAEKKAMITGISGQDGAYLAKFLLNMGYSITGILHPGRKSDLFRLEYLDIHNTVVIEYLDVTQLDQCSQFIATFKPDEIYHLAGQSSVAESIRNPYTTLDYNIFSILNLLEAVRVLGNNVRLYYSSSSEIFGNAIVLPVKEKTPLNPVNPYGISKATGFTLVKNYRELYNIYAVNGIVFNHESFLRPPHFFIKKIIQSAIQIKKGQLASLHVGNLDVRRDFGFAKEYVQAFWHMLQTDEPEDFIIASGESIMLRDIVVYVFEKLGLDQSSIVQDPKLFRPADVMNMVGDPSAILKKTNWTFTSSFYEVLDLLIEEEIKMYERTETRN